MGELLMSKQFSKKMLVFSILLILIISSLSISIELIKGTKCPNRELPDPLNVDMPLETTIFRRMSIREFTDSSISDKELSTILWAAYGLREDGKRTVSPINQEFAAVIYVFDENGVYAYEPMTHSLNVYLEGDHRDEINILQYEAPIQLALCWNNSLADSNQAGVELGQIGQNIQFSANALGLGTVVTGQIPPAVDPVDLPDNHEGMILIPVGHPKTPYDFAERPLWFSVLPKMKVSTTSISTALNEFEQKNSYDTTLSDEEYSQILWSTYGFSPFIDRSEQEPIHLKRHRTTPSAHGYYPLNILFVNENGIYRYYPNLLIDVLLPFLQLTDAQVDLIGLPIVSYVKRIDKIDVRSDIAQLYDNPNLASASMIVIPVLDLEKAKELSMESAMRFWYYETGAVAQNVMLESAAWDLSTTIIYPVDSVELRTLLNQDETIIPMMMIPIGG